MALKRKVLAPVRFVFPFDDALDASSDYDAFMRNRCDWSHLKLVDGAAPTVFVLRGLKHKERLAQESYSGTLARNAYALRCGLVALENLQVETADGSRPIGPPTRDQDGLVSEQYVESLALSMNQIIGLGSVVSAVSEVSDPLFGRLGSLLGEAR